MGLGRGKRKRIVRRVRCDILVKLPVFGELLLVNKLVQSVWYVGESVVKFPGVVMRTIS